MILRSTKLRDILFISALFLITIGGAYYIYACTKYAPWGFSDSATYLTAARNLANGTGLGTLNADGSFTPLQIFAPFYSILLSVFAGLQVDLVGTTAVLNIILFLSLIGAGGWLFWKLTNSRISALLFASLILFTPALINDYTSIMSEPLAITLGTVGFLLLLSSIKKETTKGLIASAILIGLASFTRYAFVAYAFAGGLCLLLFSPNKRGKKLKDILLFSGISLLFLVVWFAVQILGSASIGSRHYSFEFSIIEKSSQFFSMAYDVFKYWLPYRTNMIPGLRSEQFSPFLSLFIFALIILGIFFSIKKRRETSQNRNLWVFESSLILLILAYMIMLLVTYSVSTELISIDERMLSPLIPLFYALVISCALTVGQVIHPNVKFPIIGTLITIFFLVFNYHFMRTHPSEIGIFPNGYTSSVWKENQILTGKVPLPPSRPLISNAPDVVLFYLNRSAYYISTDKKTAGLNISVYDHETLSSLLDNDCAVIVLFDANQAQRYEKLANPLGEKDIADLLNSFPSVYDDQDGHILMSEKCIEK